VSRPFVLCCSTLFLAIILFLSGLFVWRWMEKSTSFPIKKIHIEGQLTHETPIEVQRIVQNGMHGGFFSLDVSSAKQALLSMPWVATVSFRRMWPSTISVRITEQQAIARFGKKGVLNASGVAFYPDVKTISSDLPNLEGSIDQASVLVNFFNALTTVVKPLKLSIVALRENTEQNWDLMLSNQMKVILGHVDPLARFQRFVAIYPKITAASNKTIVLVDLRYPNGVAVQYQESQNSPKK